jgi:2-oxoisovalerate dehydrogenase E1 component
VASLIAGELFEYLDAPVCRVASLDTWVGYHPDLEDHILPQTEDIEREAERLLLY